MIWIIDDGSLLRRPDSGKSYDKESLIMILVKTARFGTRGGVIKTDTYDNIQKWHVPKIPGTPLFEENKKPLRERPRPLKACILQKENPDLTQG